MGMRKAIRGHLEKNPDLERLMPHIKQNVGFVFTKMELLHVRDLLLSNKVKAPAKAGALAPVDVVVPAQNTGMGPEKNSRAATCQEGGWDTLEMQAGEMRLLVHGQPP